MASLILRKAWRLCASTFPLIYYFSNKNITLFIILPVLSIFIIIEILRMFLIGFNEKLFSIFRHVLKDKERNTLLTTTWFLLSVFFTVILFRRDIAITAILFLIFGDMFSAFFGLQFGRAKIIGNRSLQGSLAFFAACLFISIIMHFTKAGLPWSVVAGGALAATIIEILPLPLDDNFTIALFSGIIMTVLLRITG